MAETIFPAPTKATLIFIVRAVFLYGWILSDSAGHGSRCQIMERFLLLAQKKAKEVGDTE